MKLCHEIRPGAYADSIVLMQIQSSLANLSGIADAGVVMATAANLDLLSANRLLPDPLPQISPDDLLIVVKAESETAGVEALKQVDALMKRRSVETDGEYRPKSLRSALAMAPDAQWVLVSVPGAYASGVAREALQADRNVFLYSDNVPVSKEVELKELAARKGLMVLGPDCGTAIVGGAGLGFANRVRRGEIGIVAASGTGLQSVASRVHAMGGGISQAIGTGGRDLSEAVAARTTMQALDLLAGDDGTKVIVLLSKPPAPKVAARVVAAARATGKPTVIGFSGLMPPIRWVGNLHFVAGLDEAVTRALELTAMAGKPHEHSTTSTGFLRGLFSGGTLALETLQGLQLFLSPLFANLSVPGVEPLVDVGTSQGHTIIDLGADEFTVGRPHPMIDQDLRLRRLEQEAADPDTSVIALDVVLGDGAHPDPASELAPRIEKVLERRGLEVVVLLVGTDEDPQDLEAQRERLEAAGARVLDDAKSLIEYLARTLEIAPAPIARAVTPPRLLKDSGSTIAAINVGLESFYASLEAQGVAAIHVEWRPPARGNQELQSILQRLG
jgi:FdrA protein